MRKLGTSLRHTTTLSGALIFVTLSTAAVAQSPAGGAAASTATASETDAGMFNNDIVVTAQRREQASQDVGIAITALSGRQLTRLGVVDSTDIAKLAPSVNVAGSFGGQMLTFSIRGVTQYDYSDHTEAPNAVYVDEAYVASQQAQGFAIFDIDRVEVLKGPQGTLFGRNATGGAISFTTRKPTDKPEGFLSATYGSYNQVRIEGAAGGPISDRLSFRVSGLFNRFDPILHNLNPVGGDEWNDNTVAGRVQLRYEASDTLTADLSVFGGRSRFSTSPYQHSTSINEYNGVGQLINAYLASPTETREAIGPNGANYDENGDGVAATRPTPGGDKFGYRDLDGAGHDINKVFARKNFNRLSTWGSTLKLSADLGDVKLVSVTDYKKNHKRFALSFDNSPADVFDSKTITDTWQVSQELRLSGESDRFRWVAGLYYLHIDVKAPVAGFTINPIALEFRDHYALKTDSAAAFGQAEYDLTDKLTFIAGLRASYEHKNFTYGTDIYTPASLFLPPSAGTFVANYRTYADTSSDVLWAGKAQLNWKPQDDVLIYGGYNRGVKAGSYNAPLGGGAGLVPDSALPYGPEKLNAYEVGFKTDWLGRRLRVNGSVFYYDYKGYQAFKITNLAQQVLNTDATVKGAELEVSAAPARGLDLSVSGSYLDMTVKDINYNGIIKDRKNSFTPKWQLTALARYQWEMAGGLFSVQGDVKYTSLTYFSISNFDVAKMPARTLMNARVGFETSDHHWSLEAFVQNLTNKHYKIVGFDLSADCGCTFIGYGKPRWFGLTARYSY